MTAIQEAEMPFEWRQKAHDIKNIVATISMVADELGAGASQRGQKLSERLERSCARVLEICMEGPGARGDGEEDHSLKQVLADVATLADGLAGPEIELMSASDDIALPEKTGAAVFRILANLATNAVGALAGQAGGRISIHGTVRDDEIRVSLTDTGPGMLSNRARPAALGLPKRSGMGLSIAHTLADRIGGNLTRVRTGPDGTMFRLTFAPDGVFCDDEADNRNSKRSKNLKYLDAA